MEIEMVLCLCKCYFILLRDLFWINIALILWVVISSLKKRVSVCVRNISVTSVFISSYEVQYGVMDLYTLNISNLMVG